MYTHRRSPHEMTVHLRLHNQHGICRQWTYPPPPLFHRAQLLHCCHRYCPARVWGRQGACHWVGEGDILIYLERPQHAPHRWCCLCHSIWIIWNEFYPITATGIILNVSAPDKAVQRVDKKWPNVKLYSTWGTERFWEHVARYNVNLISMYSLLKHQQEQGLYRVNTNWL